MLQCRRDSDCCGSSTCVRVQVSDMVVGQCSSYSSPLDDNFLPSRGLEDGECWLHLEPPTTGDAIMDAEIVMPTSQKRFSKK